MATENPHAAGVPPTPPHQPPAAPAAGRPRWWRLLAIILAVPVAIFVYFFIVGPPRPKPTDATSVLRELASNPARATEAKIEGNLTETSPLPGPMGLLGEFLWTSGPAGLDAEIYTFDDPMSATGAFGHFKEPGSLLIPTGQNDADYSVTFTDANSPTEKEYRCAETSKEFACGSITAGLPVIVILRRPLEATVERYVSGDPMSAFRKMNQDEARTQAMTSGMIAVDRVLHRLGITPQPPQD